MGKGNLFINRKTIETAVTADAKAAGRSAVNKSASKAAKKVNFLTRAANTLYVGQMLSDALGLNGFSDFDGDRNQSAVSLFNRPVPPEKKPDFSDIEKANSTKELLKIIGRDTRKTESKVNRIHDYLIKPVQQDKGFKSKGAITGDNGESNNETSSNGAEGSVEQHADGLIPGTMATHLATVAEEGPEAIVNPEEGTLEIIDENEGVIPDANRLEQMPVEKADEYSGGLITEIADKAVEKIENSSNDTSSNETNDIVESIQPETTDSAIEQNDETITETPTESNAEIPNINVDGDLFDFGFDDTKDDASLDSDYGNAGEAMDRMEAATQSLPENPDLSPTTIYQLSEIASPSTTESLNDENEEQEEEQPEESIELPDISTVPRENVPTKEEQESEYDLSELEEEENNNGELSVFTTPETSEFPTQTQSQIVSVQPASVTINNITEHVEEKQQSSSQSSSSIYFDKRPVTPVSLVRPSIPNKLSSPTTSAPSSISIETISSDDDAKSFFTETANKLKSAQEDGKLNAEEMIEQNTRILSMLEYIIDKITPPVQTIKPAQPDAAMSRVIQ